MGKQCKQTPNQVNGILQNHDARNFKLLFRTKVQTQEVLGTPW